MSSSYEKNEVPFHVNLWVWSVKEKGEDSEIMEWIRAEFGISVDTSNVLLADELIPISRATSEQIRGFFILFITSSIDDLGVSLDWHNFKEDSNYSRLGNIITKREMFGCAIIVDAYPKSFDLFHQIPIINPEGKFFNREEDKPIILEELGKAIKSYRELWELPKVNAALRREHLLKEGRLTLTNQELTHIPFELRAMPWLTELNLKHNEIEKIENLDSLVKLKQLDLAHNKIMAIENLSSLSQLEFLDLEHNQIQRIENLDGNLELTQLGLSENQIKKLDGINLLTRLKTLYISRNQLSDIQGLDFLPELKRIVLSDNLITSIEPLLPYIEADWPVNLKYANRKVEEGIFVFNNPISHPPQEAIRGGKDAIVEHFAKASKYKSKKLEVLKVILVGNSGVGKTNLKQLLCGEKVDSDHISTEYLEISKWYPGFLKTGAGDPMQVNIFDFGGQDYYHDSHKLYYTHDTVYILLWDAATDSYSQKDEKKGTNEEQTYENYPVAYWLESIRYHLQGKKDSEFSDATDNILANNIQNSEPPISTEKQKPVRDLSHTAPVLVLQNKIDVKEATLNQTDLTREYPYISHFFNVSIKNGKRVSILDSVLDDCIGKLNLAGRQLIFYQHLIVDYYLTHEVEFEVLDLNQFLIRCRSLLSKRNFVFKQKIIKDLSLNEVTTIAAILSNLGVFYFDSASKATDGSQLIFTKVSMLNQYVKSIMLQAKSGDDKGVFHVSNLTDIPNLETILSILTTNKNIVKLEEGKFLAPQFLATEPTNEVKLFAEAFTHCNIRYVYTAYFHKSLVMSLFSKFLNFGSTFPQESAARGLYWRNGLILSKNNQMVMVHFVKDSEECRIDIKTMNPFDNRVLEQEVIAELERLNEGWTCTKEVSLNSLDYFTENDLKQYGRFETFTAKDTPGKPTLETTTKRGKRLYKPSDFKKLVKRLDIPIKLFISYSSKNSEYIRRFRTHLEVLRSGGVIDSWFDRQIVAGSKWDEAIQNEMRNSDLVLFLLSPDFLATSYIMEFEVPESLKMYSDKVVDIFPIELQPCSWMDTSLKQFQMILNPDEVGKKKFFVGKPDNDEAWITIIEELKKKFMTMPV